MDAFGRPALARRPHLSPTGRRHRPFVPMLFALLLLGPLLWWFTRPEPAAVQAQPPPAVAPGSTPPSPAGPLVAPPSPAAPRTTPPPTSPPVRTPPAAPSPKPKLTQFKTVGPRATRCARIVLAIDQSGSMSSYSTARDNALQQLVDWSKANLRGTDQIAVVDFGSGAAVRQAPVSARKGERIGSPVQVGSGSMYQPVLAAITRFPRTSCRTALVLLSDGELNDLPAPADALQVLRSNGIDFQRLLVPDTSITVPPAWGAAFPAGKPVYVDGLDPDETARVIGQTVSKIIGQKIKAF